MRKSMFWGFVVVAAFGIAITAVLSTSNGAVKPASGEGKKAEHSCYEPVVPMDILMDIVSDGFDEILDQLKAKKFSKVRKSSYALAEFMNVAHYHSSEEVDKNKMGDWKQIALELRGDMVKIADSAKKKDAAGVKRMLNRLEDSCEKCHDLRD